MLFTGLTAASISASEDRTGLKEKVGKMSVSKEGQ